MANEIWKDIDGYEGFYQVSNLGRVKSTAVRRCLWGKICVIERERMLTPHDNGNGYLMVQLKANNKRKPVGVHRLVATAFIENPQNYPVVNHIDYDTHNNCVHNLEWCTQKENISHSLHNMLLGNKSRVGKTGEKYITQRGDKFAVSVKKLNVYKEFMDIDGAISYRNKVVEEHKDYFGEGVI